MKKILLILLLSCWKGPLLPGQTVDPDFVDGAAYVKVWDSSAVVLDPLPNLPALNLILNTFSVDSIYRSFPSSDPVISRIYRVKFGNANGINNLISQLEQLPFVEFAEAVPLMQFVGTEVFTPNDLDLNQWHLPKVQAEDAWGISQGNASVVIAVVDNAVSTQHADLNDDIYVNTGETPNNGLDDDLNGYIDDVRGWDVGDSDNDPNPPSGIGPVDVWNHGTHCAGIAAAETNNGHGIASLGYNCKILPVKASKNILGGGALTQSYEGVHFATQSGADVISMSFGGNGTSLTGNLIIQNAFNQGIVLVAGAGNDNSSDPFFPAAYNGVIAVGATDPNDIRAGFSNYGSYLDVMAPGVNIYSSLANADSSYGAQSGTSMACPLVSGLCGLIISVNPGLAPANVETVLKNGCENIDSLNSAFQGQLGAGRINAGRTLNLLMSQDESLAGNIISYPNPFHDKIYLTFSFEVGGFLVNLRDLSGKLIVSQESTGENLLVIDQLGDLPIGFYLLELSQGPQKIVKKVIKY